MHASLVCACDSTFLFLDISDTSMGQLVAVNRPSTTAVQNSDSEGIGKFVFRHDNQISSPCAATRGHLNLLDLAAIDDQSDTMALDVDLRHPKNPYYSGKCQHCV